MIAAYPEIYVPGTSLPDELAHKLKLWTPKTDLGNLVRTALKYLPADLASELIDSITRTVIIESQLELTVLWGSNARRPFTIERLGVVSRKVITTTGVNKLTAIMNTSDPTTATNFKFHGLGTGVAAEAAADAALGTELTTQYNPDSTRATGTQPNTGNNTYQTVATNTIDTGTPAVTEQGVFSAATAGTLLDRSQFAAINLVANDGIQSTYTMTATAGG